MDPRFSRAPEHSAMAKKGFGSYKGESESSLHVPVVEETETLKQLKAVFAEFLSRDGLTQIRDERGEFTMTALRNTLLPGMLAKLNYGSEDVEKFSLLCCELPGFDPVKISIFLTSLINRGKDTDFVLHTAHLPAPLPYLLRHNTKNVIVHGDVGEFACSGMKEGHVVISGDCGSRLGQYMEGGRIDVEGRLDTGYLAYLLKEGAIYHKGELAADKTMRHAI